MNLLDMDTIFTEYLFTMTDDTGIFQHSIYGVPDPKKGYTTDDNSRALILSVMLFEKFKDKKYLKLIYTYIAFMLNAQDENGNFKNFMGYNRDFISGKGSEDCQGRCIWALGKTISSRSVPGNVIKSCVHMLNKTMENQSKMSSPRAKAYTVYGLGFLAGMEGINNRIDELSMSLVENYKEYNDNNWHWFENSMTYSNSMLPLSLISAYKILKKEIFLDIAHESMGFLGSIMFKNGYFKPIGCNGWYKKGQEPAEFDEQPIEACETLLLYTSYYEIVNERQYLDNAVKCFNWYMGINSKRIKLLDKDIGACYDGLNENGVNYNQGSESLISYGISLLEIAKKIAWISDNGHWTEKKL
jgi:hypothetical protein